MLKIFAMILLAFLPGAIRQTASSEVTARRQDVNTIYSSLMQSNNPVFLIAANTIVPGAGPNLPFPIDSCVVLRPSDAEARAEIVTEFNANKPGTGTIPSDLKLPRPYVLLSADDVREFRDDRQQAFNAALATASAGGRFPPGDLHLASPSNPKFKGATDLFLLTDVYFNRNRTFAAVFMNIWSSPLAGIWRWVVFEKTADGRWEERPQWARCGGVA